MEKEKMIAGRLYDPLDEELVADRIKTRLLLQQLNESREDEPAKRRHLLTELLPQAKEGLWLQPPFFCDYGYNLHIGENVFFNFNCLVLDVCPVTIGSRTLIGPNVQICTAMHPMNHVERASGVEFAKPISIGSDVWLGGSVVICPGVSIGDRSIIGAGSVVTKDIPPDVFAAGNPCKIIPQTTQIQPKNCGFANGKLMLKNYGIDLQPLLLLHLRLCKKRKLKTNLCDKLFVK